MLIRQSWWKVWKEHIQDVSAKWCFRQILVRVLGTKIVPCGTLPNRVSCHPLPHALLAKIMLDLFDSIYSKKKKSFASKHSMVLPKIEYILTYIVPVIQACQKLHLSTITSTKNTKNSWPAFFACNHCETLSRHLPSSWKQICYTIYSVGYTISWLISSDNLSSLFFVILIQSSRRNNS